MLEFRKITVLLFVFMLASTGLVFVTDCASAGIGGSMTGTISSDDTVTSPLSVPVSGILDISAGVTLRFQGDYDFKVLGTLRCLGTALNPVRISFDSATQGPGKWKGIIVDGGSAVFNYTIIQSASTAIHIKSTTGVEINYCHLGKSTYGIRGESSAGFSMYNTTIQDCTDRDIFLT